MLPEVLDHEEKVTAAKDPTAVEENEDSPPQQYLVDSSEKPESQ
jgi:hypothetical protein